MDDVDKTHSVSKHSPLSVEDANELGANTWTKFKDTYDGVTEQLNKFVRGTERHIVNPKSMYAHHHVLIVRSESVMKDATKLLESLELVNCPFLTSLVSSMT